MESKICTYTEKNHRLQLLRIVEDNFEGFELRYNRKCLAMFVKSEAFHARLYFSHLVADLAVDRESPMSKISPLNTYVRA